MDSIAITGGAALSGEIEIGGAKNACLALMPAALLTEEPLTLTNCPRLADIATMRALLESLGCEIASLREGRALAIAAERIANRTAHYDIVRKMRASILVLGPLLAREGAAVVSLPGGCAIGARPVDLHLSGFEKMGATLALREGYVHAEAPGGLKGARIDFPFVSVGATENLMMAATLARGVTTLAGAARERPVRGHPRQARGRANRAQRIAEPRDAVEGGRILFAQDVVEIEVAGGEVERPVRQDFVTIIVRRRCGARLRAPDADADQCEQFIVAAIAGQIGIEADRGEFAQPVALVAVGDEQRSRAVDGGDRMKIAQRLERRIDGPARIDDEHLRARHQEPSRRPLDAPRDHRRHAERREPFVHGIAMRRRKHENRARLDDVSAR